MTIDTFCFLCYFIDTGGNHIEKKDYCTAESFLKTVKREIDKRNFFIIPRKNIDIGNGKLISYREALLDLDINIMDVPLYIKKLESSDCIDISFDYDCGRDNNSEWFIFIKKINKISVYIKISLNQKGVVCLSFHRAKY